MAFVFNGPTSPPADEPHHDSSASSFFPFPYGPHMLHWSTTVDYNYRLDNESRACSSPFEKAAIVLARDDGRLTMEARKVERGYSPHIAST